MKEAPKVSIIVPVYKAEKYLHRCVDSILAQTFTEFELLLVDDGSPDNSGTICDRYAAADPRVHVFHKPNGGVSSARQCGLDNAQGEYTIHADPDDWVEPDMLQELYTEAQRTNADMVICDYFVNTKRREILVKQQPSALDNETVLNELFHQLHGSCCNKLVKRDCYNTGNVKFPVGLNYCEDLFVNACLLLQPLTVSYINKAFYHYDQYTNTNSIVNTKRTLTKATQKLIDKISPILSESHSQIIEALKCRAKMMAYAENYNHEMQSQLYPEVTDKLTLYIHTNQAARLQKILYKKHLYNFCAKHYRTIQHLKQLILIVLHKQH